MVSIGIPHVPEILFSSQIISLFLYEGDEVWHNGRIIKAHYGHNLHWLQCWSTVGVKYCSDGTLHFYVNGQDQGVAASDISGVRGCCGKVSYTVL